MDAELKRLADEYAALEARLAKVKNTKSREYRLISADMKRVLRDIFVINAKEVKRGV